MFLHLLFTYHRHFIKKKKRKSIIKESELNAKKNMHTNKRNQLALVGKLIQLIGFSEQKAISLSWVLWRELKWKEIIIYIELKCFLWDLRWITKQRKTEFRLTANLQSIHRTFREIHRKNKTFPSYSSTTNMKKTLSSSLKDKTAPFSYK